MKYDFPSLLCRLKAIKDFSCQFLVPEGVINLNVSMLKLKQVKNQGRLSSIISRELHHLSS